MGNGTAHVASNYAKLQELMREQAKMKETLDAQFLRWEELETRSKSDA
ncbi:MAG: ABC transporter C-terminal domain-containing protein [Terriglobales bacterium]